MQGDAERAAFTVAVHTGDAMQQAVATGARVEQTDLARSAFEVDDAAVGSEGEADRLVELGDGDDAGRTASLCVRTRARW